MQAFVGPAHGEHPPPFGRQCPGDVVKRPQSPRTRHQEDAGGVIGKFQRGPGIGLARRCVEVGPYGGFHHTDPRLGVIASDRCCGQVRSDQEQVRPPVHPHPVGERVRHEHNGGQVGPGLLEVDGGGCSGGKDRYDKVGIVCIHRFDESRKHGLDGGSIHEPAHGTVPPEL
jgi:hypothetical protein